MILLVVRLFKSLFLQFLLYSLGITLSLFVVGASEATFEITRKYVQDRKAFGGMYLMSHCLVRG